MSKVHTEGRKAKDPRGGSKKAYEKGLGRFHRWLKLHPEHARKHYAERRAHGAPNSRVNIPNGCTRKQVATFQKQARLELH